MSQFLGTHLNRLDAKGRVSVPATFRTALRAAGTAEGATLILLPSLQHACIDAFPVSEFEARATPLGELDVFRQEHDDMAFSLYGDAHQLEADKEGRIILPEQLKQHAALTDAVAFVGMGKTFQVWEPEAAARRREESRARARLRALSATRAA